LLVFLTIVGGLFGGAGATIIWELAIKPPREERAFARMLLTELLINKRIITGRISVADSRPWPPRGFRLYSHIFSSSAGKLSDLSTRTGALVYMSYRYFDKLTDLADQYWRYLDDGADFKEGTGKQLSESMISSWNMYLKHSIYAIDKCTVALEYSALPVWSKRRREMKNEFTAHASDIESFLELSDV
jgi:hypothetical protein